MEKQQLNPYAVKWCIIYSDRYINKKALKDLDKLGFSLFVNDRTVICHGLSPNIDLKQIDALNILKKYYPRLTFKSLIITDKQFAKSERLYTSIYNISTSIIDKQLIICSNGVKDVIELTSLQIKKLITR